MPVERMLTPRPNDRETMIQIQNARIFLDCVINFFSDTHRIYKFFLFGYITLMMLFVFVVDSKTYDFKDIGNEVYGGVAAVEAGLGFACILAIYGVNRTRTIFIIPLLILQMSIFMYGFAAYLYPYAELQQDSAIQELTELNRMNDINSFDHLRVVSKSLFMIILRMSPLFVQFLFTAFTLKTVLATYIVERVDAAELPLFEIPRTNSTKTNTHVWSSMQRKVSSRRREENLDQVEEERLPKREFVNEMSAKFRKSTFPTPQLSAPLLASDVCLEV